MGWDDSMNRPKAPATHRPDTSRPIGTRLSSRNGTSRSGTKNAARRAVSRSSRDTKADAALFLLRPVGA